jgi:hypothetical protein
MAVTKLGEFHATDTATTVQVRPGDDDLGRWWPKAGHLLVLVARYAPDVQAVAPVGWTQFMHEPQVLWQGREVAATCWYLLLHRDYDGWRYGMPPIPGIDQFELPAVHFSRPNRVELDFGVFENVEPPQLFDSGTAIGLLN